jgi:predicted small metal-binding protein
MLEVSCRDVGQVGCAFVATAPSMRKLENVMLVHMRDEHPELIAGITEEEHEAMMRKIAELAHETASI